MIRMKEIRFASHVAGLSTAGNLITRDVDAEIWVDGKFAMVRRRATSEDFMIPLSGVEYMKPFMKLDVFLEIAPDRKPELSNLQKMVDQQIAATNADPHPTPIANIVASIADDTKRMVKINGVIVERSGPPQDDELEAITAPRKSVAQMIAEVDGAADDE